MEQAFCPNDHLPIEKYLAFSSLLFTWPGMIILLTLTFDLSNMLLIGPKLGFVDINCFHHFSSPALPHQVQTHFSEQIGCQPSSDGCVSMQLGWQGWSVLLHTPLSWTLWLGGKDWNQGIKPPATAFNMFQHSHLAVSGLDSSFYERKQGRGCWWERKGRKKDRL